MNFIVKTDCEHPNLFHYFDGKEWQEKWENRQDACMLVMENHFQELEPIRKQVLEGELSPLAYHIKVLFLSLKILSSYTGIPKHQIKKHLKAEHFNRLDEETLKKYAVALGITMEELKKV